MKRRIFLACLAMLLMLCAIGAAEEQRTETAFTDHVVVTDHTTMIGGQFIPYTTTTGTMAMDTNMGKYEIFYTAYVRNDTDFDDHRPITFAFNGGPGASSMYVHMGFLGPKRISLDAEGNATKLPANLIDNDASILDLTDLVFIDPVGTGYSRVLDGTETDEFYSYKGDTASVGDFIRQYINRNKRWSSPKYLLGESYGTTRAVSVCNYLAEQHGMYLNGIVLVSSINDFSSSEFNPGNDLPYELYIPTYAADAWYHKAIDSRYLEMSIEAYLDEVREFVAEEYAPALFKGRRLSEKEKDQVADRLSGYIGLPKSLILQKNLRIDLNTFCSKLLEEQKLMVGRMDGRITGPVTSGSIEDGESDPSNASVDLVFGTAVSQYLTEELNYQTDRPYVTISVDVNGKWNFNIESMGYLSQGEMIYNMMSKNPFLKIWVLCGYYDGATPFHAAEWVYDHIYLQQKAQDNLMFTYYPSGHMIYTEESSRLKFRTEAEKWFGTGK